AESLRATFDASAPLTVGIEEELMLLDPETLDLRPCAPELLARLDGDARFKGEMPAAQLEIAGTPAATIGAAAAELLERRIELAQTAAGVARIGGAGVHPFAAAEGVLNGGERYDAIAAEYGTVARRQLVFGLHVHVAVAGADRALAVYNGLREQLPALAALGAASPFYEGRDSGLASVRPKLCDLLPRQGVPPAIPSWEALADTLAWGRQTGAVGDPGQWWWEARLHHLHGTIELRVADTQATVADTAAIGALVQALVATLADRHDAGEDLGAAPSWRIGENRWSACRHGVEGRWLDVRTGGACPMRDHLHALIDAVAPAAARLRCAAELEAARDLVERPRATMARQIAHDGGARALAAWQADRFLVA
ncbi:MAG: glutamate---cysteine ligase / carboxylate-amine ligase, partial [Baekduia sp.]|nr:glutamate---cysteine ligase / carboxylate-amine ligase [Baekduia sp.]